MLWEDEATIFYVSKYVTYMPNKAQLIAQVEAVLFSIEKDN